MINRLLWIFLLLFLEAQASVDEICSHYFARVVAVSFHRIRDKDTRKDAREIFHEVFQMTAEDLFTEYGSSSGKTPKKINKCVSTFKFLSMDREDYLIITKSITQLVQLKKPQLLQAALETLYNTFSPDQRRILESKVRPCGGDSIDAYKPLDGKNYLVPVFAQIHQILKCSIKSESTHVAALPDSVGSHSGPQDQIVETNRAFLTEFNDKKKCSETFAIAVAVTVDSFTQSSYHSLTQYLFGILLRKYFSMTGVELWEKYNQISRPNIKESRPNGESADLIKPSDWDSCTPVNFHLGKFYSVGKEYSELARQSLIWLDGFLRGSGLEDFDSDKKIINAAFDYILNILTPDQQNVLYPMVELTGFSTLNCAKRGETTYLPHSKVSIGPPSEEQRVFHQLRIHSTDANLRLRLKSANVLEKFEDLKKCSETYSIILAVAVDNFVKSRSLESSQPFPEHLNKAFRMTSDKLHEAYKGISVTNITDFLPFEEPPELCAAPVAGQFFNMDRAYYFLSLGAISHLMKMLTEEEEKTAAIDAIISTFTTDQRNVLTPMAEINNDYMDDCDLQTKKLNTTPFRGTNYLGSLYSYLHRQRSCLHEKIEKIEARDYHASDPDLETKLAEIFARVSGTASTVHVPTRPDHVTSVLPPVPHDARLDHHDAQPIDDESFHSLTAAKEQNRFFANLQRVVHVIAESNYRAVHAAVHLRVLESYIMVLTKALDQMSSLAESKKGVETKLKDVLSQVSIAIGKSPSS